jgi:hypothetical protein
VNGFKDKLQMCLGIVLNCSKLFLRRVFILELAWIGTALRFSWRKVIGRRIDIEKVLKKVKFGEK